MNSWDTITFEDLYLEPSRNGLTKPKRVRGEGYKMVNMGELFSDDRIGDIPMERVPMSDREINSYLVRVGDLLFARQSLVAAGAGKCSIIIATPEPTTFESHLIRIRLDTAKADPLFYFYYFSSTQGKGNIQSLVMQVAAAGIRGSELARLSVPCLPLSLQKKIAAILSAYDNLIENNNRRIKILEVMAKLIYQEWFINYNFPGNKKVNMVDSPSGNIPEGWTLGKLDDVLMELESGSRPKGGVGESEQGIPSIGAENILGLGKYDYSKEKYVSSEYFDKMRRGHVKSGDVLLYKDGAHIGRKALFRDNFPHEICCINEHVFILRSNARITQNYLFFWLDLPNMTEMIRNLNANAAQPGINQVSVRGLPILIPTREILDAFQNTIEPLIAQLFNLAKQNRILQITRDRLQPKLISGEVDISELDIDIGEEAV